MQRSGVGALGRPGVGRTPRTQRERNMAIRNHFHLNHYMFGNGPHLGRSGGVAWSIRDEPAVVVTFLSGGRRGMTGTVQ